MYRQFYQLSNLYSAYKKAAKGKRGKPGVAAFEHRLEEQLIDLHSSFITNTYTPGRYVNFYIKDPKRRLISAAPFRDRVVHHALCNVIEPLFEPGFIFDSYANRVGKGTHRARTRAQQFARQFRFVLHLDVKQFFPGIDHRVLQRLLFRKVKDERLQRVINLILESGKHIHKTKRIDYFEGDSLFDVLRPRGLPIGNLTSQFWANVYLNGLDQFIKRRLKCKGYLRYVDDLLLFSDEKKILWRWKRAIVDYLAGLRLRLHPCAQVRPVREGFGYLGFQIFPEKIRLKRRKGVNFRRKLYIACAAETPDVQQINASVEGWMNHARYGNTIGLQKVILAPVKHFWENDT